MRRVLPEAKLSSAAPPYITDSSSKTWLPVA